MNRVLVIPSVVLLLLGVVAFVWSRDPGGSLVQGAEGGGKPIVFATADEISTLDVGKMSWMNDIRVAMGLWEGLVAYEPKTLEIVPGVAEKWEISADGKTYRFHLRKDARWSNGEAVRAGDFVFAWKRVLTPANGSNYMNLLFPIAGAEAYFKAVVKNEPADFSTVGVSAPDGQTLVVRLTNRCPYFLDLCAFVPLSPLHEEAMRPFLLDKADPSKGYDGRWTRPPNLVSNGAFYLKEWEFKRQLVLAPNPHYWDRGNVRTSEIIVKAYEDPRTGLLAYQEGAVDVLSYVPRQFGEELLGQRDRGERSDVHFKAVFGTYYYIFNCGQKPVNDKRVRQALARAIDKKRIVTQVLRMGETACDVLVPPNSIPGYTGPQGLPMDVALARKLLAEAGYPEGRGFPTLDILYNTETPNHLQVAQAIGQMWKNNLGIAVSLRGVERGSFGADRQKADFTVARGGWYGDYTDPTTWLDLLKTGDGNNDGKFSNPEYDALLAAGALETNPAKRFELLSQAERIVVEDEFPLAPLYQYSDGFIFDEKKIENLYLNVRLMTEFKWLKRSGS